MLVSNFNSPNGPPLRKIWLTAGVRPMVNIVG
jgi:hypothetical protein